MMLVETFETTLRELLQARPFQPFQIEFDDGDVAVVGHPRAVSYLGGASELYFGPDHNDFLFHNIGVRRIVKLVPAPA
jgi:hypothetical protein